MPAKVFSVGISGLSSQIIEIEVDASYGLRHFEIVGLPDKAVEEAKERVGSAIASSHFQAPHHQPLRVLVSLAPADLKKEGSSYDLPIALGYLAASKQIKFDSNDKIFSGELALDGKLRPVKGVLAIALNSKQEGFKEIILPKENSSEASLIKGIRIIGAETLQEVIEYLAGKKQIIPCESNISDFLTKPDCSADLGLIRGQEYAKRSLEILAAGSHNLMMQGPPGAGKTLLAKAVPSILPELTFEESLEVSKIYSIAGLLDRQRPFINLRPFRSPHHTSSEVALIGGGNPPRPGEITLAHRGVLFLRQVPQP